MAPLCRGRQTQKYGAGCSEKSPLLLTEGGTAQAVTGVEGTRCDFRTALKHERPHIRHGLRPMTPCSSGMTATGSHGYFYSLRGAQPQGEGFSRKPSVFTSGGRTLPPAPSVPPPSSEGGKGLAETISPHRPSSGRFAATFPQGKADLRRSGAPAYKGKAFSPSRQTLRRL